MPSTSVHIPEDMLRRLDRVAKERRVSRNRLIVDACRLLLDEGERDWPADFFADEMAVRDRTLLNSTFEDWLAGLQSARRSRKSPPF